jgi:hypothetical protein
VQCDKAPLETWAGVAVSGEAAVLFGNNGF